MIRFFAVRPLSAAVFVLLAGCGGSAPGASSLPAASSNAQPHNAAPAIARPSYRFVDLGAGPNGGPAEALGANATRQGGDYVYTRDSCGKDCSFNVYHALAWTGSGSTPVDITPPLIKFAEAWVYGGSAGNLAGYGVTDQGGYFGVPHALFWHGATLAYDDINPAGDSASWAYALNGTSIVGSGISSCIPAARTSNPRRWAYIRDAKLDTHRRRRPRRCSMRCCGPGRRRRPST